jgi:integrase
MGRRRRIDKHLPRRMYLRRGAYYFADLRGKWHPLGKDLAEALARYGQKVGGAWSSRTLGDVIDRYRAQVLPLKRSPATRQNEGAALTRLKQVFGHMLPDSVTPPMIYRYIDERKKKDGNPAPEAARHEIVLLGHVYKKAVRWGAASTNPVRGIEKFPRAAKRPAVPIADVEQVRAIASGRMQCAIDLAVCLGPRRGDVLRLRRGNLTDEGIRFTAGKTQREQLIEWSDELRAIVERCKALTPQVPGEYLIRTEGGKPYTASGFSANWQRLMRTHVKAGGQRFTFHDLRSVAASGGTLEDARDRLGHADASTTQRFYRRGVQRGRPRT